jgi:aspartate aminotransferase-like enzyme
LKLSINIVAGYRGSLSDRGQAFRTRRENLAIFHPRRPPITRFVMPTGHDADHFRDVVLKHFDMSLGAGLSKLKGRVFRIGHLGHFNDLMLMGTLSGVEMALDLARSLIKRAACSPLWRYSRAKTPRR